MAVPLALLVVALALGLGGRSGRLCACLAIGALAVWSRPKVDGSCFSAIELDRPVQVVGVVEREWRRVRGSWTAGLAVRRVRQDGLVRGCQEPLVLSFGGSGAPRSHGATRVKGFVRRSQVYRNGTRRHPVRAPPAFWSMHVKSNRFLRPDRSVRLSMVDRAGRSLRAFLRPAFGVSGRRTGASAARALVLGDPRALDDEFRRSLRRFGLAHLFAVSGLHVALVALLVHGVLGPLPRRARTVLAGSAVLGYLLLVGARSPIVRAVSMVLLGSTAGALHRARDPRQGLCLAAAGLALVDPRVVGDLGYQLTVSACAGILWLSPLLEIRWQWLPAPLRAGLAATFGAQVASLPWAATAFSMVHPLAPLLNLIAVPWVVGFGLLAFAGTVLLRAWPALGEPVLAVLDAGVAPLVALEKLPASGFWTWPVAMTFFEALLAAAALGTALLVRSGPGRLLAVGVAALLLLGPSQESRQWPAAEVILIDVGQGDAVLIRDRDSAVLFDGGGWRRGDVAARVTLPALARLGVRRLDRVVVSHPDVDHCGGLADLARYIPIGAVWTGPGTSKSDCVRELTSLPGMRWRTLWRGETATVGGLIYQVVHPPPGSSGLGNDASVVVKVVAGRHSILLTGDIEAAAERELVRAGSVEHLRAEIVKIAHHGSRTSTTAGFLAVVQPRLAVISAGRRNHYGHPSPEVLRRLSGHHVRVLRTDRDGMIRLSLGTGPQRISAVASARR